jgi:hypothetical protein
VHGNLKTREGGGGVLFLPYTSDHAAFPGVDTSVRKKRQGRTQGRRKDREATSTSNSIRSLPTLPLSFFPFPFVYFPRLGVSCLGRAGRGAGGGGRTEAGAADCRNEKSTSFKHPVCDTPDNHS